MNARSAKTADIAKKLIKSDTALIVPKISGQVVSEAGSLVSRLDRRRDRLYRMVWAIIQIWVFHEYLNTRLHMSDITSNRSRFAINFKLPKLFFRL